jgi:hypothetical protein
MGFYLRIGYPHLESLITTGVSYFVLTTMIDCVALRQQQRYYAFNVAKMLSLALGINTFFGVGYRSNYEPSESQHKNIFRHKIEVLCSREKPDESNMYQVKTYNEICNNDYFQSPFDLEKLCGILESNHKVCD